MLKTYNTLYLDTRQKLRLAGVEAAQLEARELICFASGKGKDEFFASLQLYATPELEERLRGLVQRRLDGEPLAYILGEWDFMGLNLLVTPDTLIPRSDTETVAQRAIELAARAGDHARVLDLCCGTGCIGLAVAQRCKNCRVVLADVNQDTLDVARKNTLRTGLSGQITTFAADALQPPPRLIWDFNLIVCNPPYIRSGDIAGLDASVRDYEPHLALDGGADGLDFYRSVTQQWKGAMRSACVLLFEVGYDQAEDVAAILAASGYHNIQKHPDWNGVLRAVEGTLS
ncbi:MAG: peptide chain release factor N(5)-glutamine methyltransferase [Clostridiales bacterium]|nr:peptide chain release factor N(5)-glutamine methyltransferase [Clostridiales bacterium]